MDFVQRTVRRLDQIDPILGVALGDLQPAQLGLQLLGDAQTGGIIGSALDPQPARESLDAPGERVGCKAEITPRDRSILIGVKPHPGALGPSYTSAECPYTIR